MESLSGARIRHAFDLWAYVIMPEHVHLLIWPREDFYSISKILTSIKTPVARRALAWLRANRPGSLHQMEDRQPGGTVTHRFWQRGGGYDRNLTTPELIHATIDYIHANPVRRGLVESPDDWPWSTAGFYAGTANPPLIPDVHSIPPRS